MLLKKGFFEHEDLKEFNIDLKEGRTIYYNNEKNLAMIINKDDHLIIESID